MAAPPGPLPSWVTRAVEPVRSWYVVAHSLGIDGEGIGRIARLDPLVGIAPRHTPINLLSIDGQRLAIANAYAIALARSGGDAESFKGAALELERLQRALGFCKPEPTGCRPGSLPPGAVLGIWSRDIRRAFARLARPLDVYETSSKHTSRIILAILALICLGFAWRISADGQRA